MQTNNPSNIDPNEIVWDAEPDIVEDEIQWDAEPDLSVQGVQAPGVQGVHPSPTPAEPVSIWDDPSFTGAKPVEEDEGPTFFQRFAESISYAYGGAATEALMHLTAGTEPYLEDPDDLETVKPLMEGYKSTVKSVGQALELLTQAEADLPDVGKYDLGNPLDRSNYYFDLLQSKAFNTINEAVAPIFDKVSELEMLQPDLDYYERLENKDTMTRYAEEVIGMAPQMATQVAAHLAGGPVTSGVWMAMQIAGAEYGDLIDQGVDPERAEAAAFASAMSQAPLEMLSLGIVLNNPVGRKLVKGGLTKFGINRLVGGATEFLTETFQKIPSMFWENWAKDPDYINKLREDPAQLKTLAIQGFKEGMKEGAIAAFYGAILGAGGDIDVDKGKKADKIPVELSKEAQSVLGGLAEDLKEGTITRQDIDAIRRQVEPTHPLYEHLTAIMGPEPAAKQAPIRPAEAPAEGERLPELEKLAQAVFKEEAAPEITRVDPKKKNVRSVITVAEALGLDIVVYKGKGAVDGLNGLVDSATGQIYLNENAADPYLTVLGHESLHRLKKDHGDLYDTLVDKVKELEVDLTDYLAHTNKARKAAGVAEITAEEALATEEYIADFVGHQFTKEDFWKKLEEKDPSLGKQLAEIVYKMVEAIKTAMRKGKKVDAQFFKQMNAAQDALASVYSEFARREAKISEPVVDKAKIEGKHRAADMPNALEYDHIVKGLTKDQKEAAADILEAYDMPMKERVAALKKAVGIGKRGVAVPPPEIPKTKEGEAPAKPVKKAKATTRGENVRTLRGAILAAGGIKWGDQFKGERKDHAPGAKYLTRQKTGIPWDTLEQQLKDDGWLGPDETLLDVLNNEDNLKRGRLTEDILEKKEAHLTEKERELKAEIDFEAEEPPPGNYQVMNAEDLPEGKEMVILEEESTRGWDVYKVVEKDPFGVTLKDGTTIELAPEDKVQVRKMDLPADMREGAEAQAALPFSAKNVAVNEPALADLINPLGEAKTIGDETGKFNKDGVSVFKNPAGSVRYVYAIDGNIVSGLQVMDQGEGKGIAANAFTLPEHRRKGYASELVEKAKADFAKLKPSVDVSEAGQVLKDLIFNERVKLSFKQTRKAIAELPLITEKQRYRIYMILYDDLFTDQEKADLIKMIGTGSELEEEQLVKFSSKRAGYYVEPQVYAERRGDTGPFHDTWRIYTPEGHRTSKIWTSQEAAENEAKRLNEEMGTPAEFKNDLKVSVENDNIPEFSGDLWRERYETWKAGVERDYGTVTDKIDEYVFRLRDWAFKTHGDYKTPVMLEFEHAFAYGPVDEVFIYRYRGMGGRKTGQAKTGWGDLVMIHDPNAIEISGEPAQAGIRQIGYWLKDTAPMRVTQMTRNELRAIVNADPDKVKFGTGWMSNAKDVTGKNLKKWVAEGGKYAKSIQYLMDVTGLDEMAIARAWKKGDEALITRLAEEGLLMPEKKVPGITKYTGKRYPKPGAGEQLHLFSAKQLDLPGFERKYLRNIMSGQEAPTQKRIISDLNEDERYALNKVFGFPVSGSKEVQAKRFMDLYGIRTALQDYAATFEGAEALKGQYKREELRQMAKTAKIWSSGNKQQLAGALLSWRDRTRMMGLRALADSYEQAGRKVPEQIRAALNTKIGKIGALKQMPEGIYSPGDMTQQGWNGRTEYYVSFDPNDKRLYGEGELTYTGEPSRTQGPIDVIYTTEGKLLVEDGWHRIEDARKKGKTSIGAWMVFEEDEKARYSPKSYVDLDKPTQNAFNRASRTQENGEENRKRMKKHQGTAWEKVAVQATLTRQAIEDILQGKTPEYYSAVTDKKSTRWMQGLVDGGEGFIWDYLRRKTFLGESKKPLRCVSGSFAACDPSKKCVDVCYASNGRRQPSVFLKAESVNWAIQKDPVKSARLTALQYEALLDFEAKKALRLFDRGEADGPAWTKFIQELNRERVRAQVFSKKPDFLRSISDFNLKLLSIDSSNMELADANPDLALGIIYEGAQDLDMLEKYRERFETKGGVILPAIGRKYEWSEADIGQLPAWAENYTCPIDAGYRKIGAWNCTKCDSADGLPGCFYGKSTAKILGKLPPRLTMDEISYRVEDLKKFGKELPDGPGEHFYQELDLLLSEIRGGSDPGSAGALEETFQSDYGEGQRPVSDQSGIERAEGTVEDEDTESGKAKFSAKFKKPTKFGRTGQLELPMRGAQYELDFKGAIEVKLEKPPAKKAPEMAPAKAPKAVKRDLTWVEGLVRRTRMATTGWIGSAGKLVRNVDEAASLLAPIRKGAQEEIYLATTDKTGLVLEVQRYTKGLTASAPFDIVKLAGHIYRMKGAKYMYFAHNHPSGDPSPSPEDMNMLKLTNAFSSVKGVEVKGLIIGGTGYYDMQTGSTRAISPILRTMKLPVKERHLQNIAGITKPPQVNNSREAWEYIKKAHNDAEGFLLLDAKNNPVGFIGLDKPTTMRDMTSKLLSAAEGTNAMAMIFNSRQTVDMVQGRTAFFQSLTSQLGKGLQIHDIIEQGMSHADQGSIRKYRLKEAGIQEKLGDAGSKKALYSVKSPGWYSQMVMTLDKKLQGKGTAEQFASTVQALAKKGEFKAEELEWSGLQDWFNDHAGEKLTKAQVIEFMAANDLSLMITETEYREDVSEGDWLTWPTDTREVREYSTTWTHPLTQKKHLFEIEKEKLDDGTPYFILSVDGATAEEGRDERALKALANDWADDIYHEEVDKNAKLDWEHPTVDGKIIPGVWKAVFQDPITNEFTDWEIQKVKENGRDRFHIYQNGDSWDDTAGESLPEARAYVEQEIKDYLFDQLDQASGFGEVEMTEGTKHERWTLPERQNYRELLLKLPKVYPEIDNYDVVRMEDGRVMETFDKVEDALAYIDENGGQLVGRRLEGIVDRWVELDEGNFTHDHWSGEMNVVAHTRFDDRIDSKGRKLLFLEEIQSDWHQIGRKEGYKGELAKKAWQKFENEINQAAKANNADMKEVRRAFEYLKKYPLDTKHRPTGWAWKYLADVTGNTLDLNRFHDIPDEYGERGVPDAPFKKTWPMLIIKRMVRYAANMGYDALAWTPGDVQNRRYSLSQFVERVYYNPKMEVLFAFDKDGGMPVKESGVPPWRIPEYIGEELSEKLLASEPNKDGEHLIEGKDLQVGGQEMRDFYDKILKAAVNKFFGKNSWGNAHVEVSKIVTVRDQSMEGFAKWYEDQGGEDFDKLTDEEWQAMKYEWEHAGTPGKQEEVWVLPITTQMREKALQEGMPLFSVKRTLQVPDTSEPSTKDYRAKFSVPADHPAHAAATAYNDRQEEHVIRFDGEWDRSALDMDPMYQFTIIEGPATGATFTAESMDQADIEEKLLKVAVPIMESRAVMSFKQRLDPITETYIRALQAAQPDAFIITPDISQDPADELDEDIAKRMDAGKGLGRLTWWENTKDTMKEIWHSSTRHRPYLDPKEFPDVANVLRIHQEVPSNSVRRAGQVLGAIMGELKPNQLKVFTHKLLIDDMIKDVESGLLEDPENLPFGFTEEKARAYLEHLNNLVAADPATADAIRRRQAFNRQLRQALVDAKLLPEAVLEDDRYFHHQVLQHRAVKEIGGEYFPGIGVSSKDVRLHKKGWQRGRIGSEKDYNTDYAESEFEVISQAIGQLETKASMIRIKELTDILPNLKWDAKNRNHNKLYELEAARLTQLNPSDPPWTPAQVMDEADPLRPFKSEISKGLNWIGNLAKKGELENGSRDFTDVLEALDEWQDEVLHEKIMAEEDGRDPRPIPFPFDELGGRAWAYFSHMMREDLPGAPAAGIIFRAIRQRDQFIKDYLGKKFTKPNDLIPDGYTVWKPAPGTSWYKAYSISDRIVDQVQAGEIVIGPENAEKIKQILARGRDIEWVIPTDIAKTLDGYDVKYEDHMLSTASRKLMTGWKQWILINPYRVIKYNLNNMSGDLDIALAYDPRIIFKYLGPATKDLYKDWKGKTIPPELKKELDLAYTLGVIGSGWSVQEIGDVVSQLSYDRHMQALTGQKPPLIKRGWRSLQAFTNYRENMLRLAAFRYFKARLEAGDQGIYAASNKAEIDGIEDLNEKAAKLSRELIGDYGNITHSGQWLRRHLIPFYAWMEVNAPRYVRLIRNVKHEGQGARRIGRIVPLASGKIAWKGTKLAMKATAIYVLANLWNRTFFPDEDDELGEAQRRQLHIILPPGRRKDGTILTVRFQGALSDALSWFGGEDIHKDIEDLVKKKKTWGEYAKETVAAPAIKIIQGVRPDVKASAEVMSGQSYYPDPFNPRPVYDKLEHVTRLFSLDQAYRWIAGKPKRGDTVGERLVNDLMSLGFYTSDPGETAYYDIKSRTFDFLKRKGEEKPSVTPTDKGTALYYYKQALKYGDLKAAEKYLQKYMDLGGTDTGVTRSISRSHPLGSLPKKYQREFLETLTEGEQERYDLALRWYIDTYHDRPAAEPIPPAGGGPDQPATGGNSLRELHKLLQE